MAYSKSDIVKFIQESIESYDGLSPTMVNEISTIVKTQVEMGDADAYIKNLNNDNQEIKALLEDVLEGTVEVDATVNVTNNNKITAAMGPTGADSAGVTFKEVLQEDIKHNRNIMAINKDAMRDAVGEIRNGLGTQLNTVLGEEKENLIDPMVSVGKGVGRMFGAFQTVGEEQIDIAGESRDTLNDIYTIQKDQLELDKDLALRQQREKEEKEEAGFFEKWIKRMAMTAAIAFALGGALRAVIIPFVVFGNIMVSVGKKLGIVNQSVDGIIGLLKAIGSWTKQTNVFRSMASFFDGLGDMKGSFQYWKNALKSFTSLDAFIDFVGGLPDQLGKLGRWFGGVSDAVDVVEDVANPRAVSRIGALIMRIGDIFTKSYNAVVAIATGDGIIGKFIKFMGGFFTRIRTIMGLFWKLGTKLGVFATFFKAGFRLLGWPLTILMGAIDFIKGFVGSSEKSFLGKLKDGVKQVIMGFFEMPLKLLGWIYDKALNWIGIESSGSGQKMVDGLGKAMEAIFGPIVSVLNFIIDVIAVPLKMVVVTIRNLAKAVFKTIGGLFKMVLAPIKFMISVIIRTFVAIKEVVAGLFKGVVGVIAGIIAAGGKIISALVKFITFDFEGAFDDLGDLKTIFIGVLDTLIEGVEQILAAPVDLITSIWGHFKTALSSLFDGLVQYLTAPFNFIGDQVDGMFGILKETIEGSFLDPIITLFEKLGGFIDQIFGWVKKQVTKLPGIGLFFQSEEEKAAKQRSKDVERIAEIQEKKDNIITQLQRTQNKKKGKWDLGSKARKIKGYKKDLSELSEEEDELRARLNPDLKKRNSLTSKTEAEANLVTDTVHMAKHVTGRQDVAKARKKYDKNFQYTPTETQIVQNEETAPEMPMTDLEAQIAKKYSLPSVSQMVHHSPPPMNNIRQASDRVEAAKMESVKKQQAEQMRMTAAVKEGNKESKAQSERPIVVNTGSPEKRIIEPPQDIESMSILWLNKSWGLG